MKIVIDLQGAQSGSRHRGIGRYSLSLAKAMVQIGRDHEFIILLNGLLDETIEPIRALFDGLVNQENIRVWTAAGPVSAMNPGNLWRRQAAELAREAFLLSLNPDVVYVSSLVEGFDDNSVHSMGRIPNSYCTAVTFYDVIPLLQSEIYLDPHPGFAAAYREKIGHLRNADLFFAISESSKREAIDHLGADPDRVTSIGAAVDAHFHPLSLSTAAEAAIRHRLGLLKPFIMYSGATDERKNHLRLIKAFSMLPRKLRANYQLALVGRLPPHHQEKFRAQAVSCGLTEEDVVITGGVPDLDLHQLYNLCELFVFPSWHEGFGLPALEAMACGAAVIGSNTTSLPEVIGRADALFDPFDEHAIADKISETLTNHAFRQSLRDHGLQQSTIFSWEKSASLVLGRLERWHSSHNREQTNRLADLPALLIDRISAVSPPSSSVHDWTQTAEAIAQNHPRAGPRQLFIDVSEIAQRDTRGGIQRVVRAVLSNILLNKLSEWQVILVRSTAGEHGYRKAVNYFLTFLGLPSQDQAEQAIEPRNGDVFLLGLDLDWNAIIHDQYLRSLRNLGVRIFFVLYDLIPVTLYGAYPPAWNMPVMQARWLDVAQQQDGVICISRAVADEFKEWMNSFGNTRLRPLKVGFFHLGADMAGSVPSTGLESDSELVLQELAKKITFLSVGTIEPRKGQVQTIRAFDLLWAKGFDLNLVLVGKRGWDGTEWHLDDTVKMLESHPERGRRLFWLEAISDEYLSRIYEQCDCLLATSAAEGFGIPIIEAAIHGLPVIARDLPVFREVAGDHAHYFNGSAAESLATEISEWIALNKCGRAASSAGIRWLTWKQSTEMLFDVFLRNHWYYEWRSGKEMRFRAVDGRFGTMVGQRQAREMVTTGTAGCLLHGPYISLEAGCYKVTFKGSALNVSGAHVDASIEKGKILLGRKQLNFPESPLTGILASFDFAAPEKCRDLEVRLWVEADSHIAVSHVEITPIDSPVAGNMVAPELSLASQGSA